MGAAGEVTTVQAPERLTFRTIEWRLSDVLLCTAPFVVLRLCGLLAWPFVSQAVMYRLWMPLNICSQVLTLFFLLWIARRKGIRLLPLPRLRAVVIEALFALLAIPVVIAALALIHLAVEYFGAVAEPTAPYVQLARSFTQSEWIGFAVMAAVLAPLVEEIFFRGVIYNALRRRFPLIAAVVVQAVFFGLLHPLGVANFVGITTIAIVLALLYERRRTLLTPILLHGTVNALSTLALAMTVIPEPAGTRIGVYGDADRPGMITEIVAGGPADKAGLQPGDVLTAVNDNEVADLSEARSALQCYGPGDTVTIDFTRDGTKQQAEVTLPDPSRRALE